MAQGNEYQDIKAGVDGMIGDAPAPPEAPEALSTTEVPETQITEQTYEQPPLVDYGQQYAASANGRQVLDSERVQQIVEAIVKEKWDELQNNVGNIAVWKEKVTNDIIAVKQEVIRINERFENLQNAILGRVKEYDEGMKGVHTEMKALEKVFEKILDPLTSNIKEMGRLVQEMKKPKK